jgi:hypothetical protein
MSHTTHHFRFCIAPPTCRHRLLSCHICRPPPRPQVALDPPHHPSPRCCSPLSAAAKYHRPPPSTAGHRSSIAVQPTPSAKVMSHSSGGVIHLDNFDADVEEVGSDVEEVITWDHKLCGTKTFLTGILILPRPLLSSVPSKSSGLFTSHLSSSTHMQRGTLRTWSIALPHFLCN